MKTPEKHIIATLTCIGLALFISASLKADEAAAATCKPANQTCFIMILNGDRTSFPGILTIR